MKKRRPSGDHAVRHDSMQSRRGDDASAYHAEGVLYLDPAARFDHLLNLPEGAAVGEAVNAGMRAIERDNPQLAGVLPKTYEILTSTLLKELLKKVSEIPAMLDYDAFGRIYEYFLGEFARRARGSLRSTRRTRRRSSPSTAKKKQRIRPSSVA